jgi:hypothetical protein
MKEADDAKHVATTSAAAAPAAKGDGSIVPVGADTAVVPARDPAATTFFTPALAPAASDSRPLNANDNNGVNANNNRVAAQVNPTVTVGLAKVENKVVIEGSTSSGNISQSVCRIL